MKRNDDGLIAKEGYPFCIGPFIVGLLLVTAQWTVVGVIFLALGVFCLYFFRNPPRFTPRQSRAVIAPADGRVIQVDPAQHEHRYLGIAMQKISIFMSPLNVHVNRFPVSGVIRRVAYSPGRFFSANRDKASEENEQNAIIIETSDGERVLMVQVAGFLARRIACWAEEGDRVEAGQRAGLIRFGSRVDLFLSPRCRIAVNLGQKVRAGETIVGYLP